MNSNKSFYSKPRHKVLVSKSFREVLISQETSIIEQRIIVVILSAIKDDQDYFIKLKKNKVSEFSKELNFDHYFDGIANQGLVDFILSFNDLNPKTGKKRKMKNSAIQNALINMSNLNWLRLKDESIRGFKAVPFILDPRWNMKNIYFKMDKAVIQHLVSMERFFPVTKDLPFKTSSASTLRFLLWLKNYEEKKFARISYQDLLKDLSIPFDKYEGCYRFDRDFLNRVKADLDEYNTLSFNYFRKNEEYLFYLTSKLLVIGRKQESISISQIQIDNAIKYLKSKRNLDNDQLKVMRELYEKNGYVKLSEILKRKINNQLQGNSYIAAVKLLIEKSMDINSENGDNNSVQKDNSSEF